MKMAGLKPNWRKMEKVIEMADEWTNTVK